MSERLIFTLVSTDWPGGQYRLGQGAYMLCLPTATSPLEHPTAVGTAPDSPPGASARCARASGSPTGRPVHVLCPSSLEKVPQEIRNLPGPSPRLLRRAARV